MMLKQKCGILGRPPQNHNIRLKRANSCPPTYFLLPVECNSKKRQLLPVIITFTTLGM